MKNNYIFKIQYMEQVRYRLNEETMQNIAQRSKNLEGYKISAKQSERICLRSNQEHTLAKAFGAFLLKIFQNSEKTPDI